MDEDKINYFSGSSIEETRLWLKKHAGVKEEHVERFADGLVNGRREARVFYESHLSKERLNEIRSSTETNEDNYLRELIKAYSEFSALNNETMRKNNEGGI